MDDTVHVITFLSNLFDIMNQTRKPSGCGSYSVDAYTDMKFSFPGVESFKDLNNSAAVV